MRARYYSPELRRFINADIIAGEITNAITLNRYAYANGNPVSNTDPFGAYAVALGTGANTSSKIFNNYVGDGGSRTVCKPYTSSTKQTSNTVDNSTKEIIGEQEKQTNIKQIFKDIDEALEDNKSFVEERMAADDGSISLIDNYRKEYKMTRDIRKGILLENNILFLKIIRNCLNHQTMENLH